jgi:CRP-like cAMP-binding protein
LRLLKINKEHMEFLVANGLEFVNADYIFLRSYHKGEYLFRQGEQINCIYLLYQGKVNVSVTSNNGKTLLLSICKNPTLLGEIEFFTDGLATTNALAMDRSLLLIIPFAQVRNVEGNERFLSFLGLSLAKKLTRTVQNNTLNILNLADTKVSSYILLTNVNGRFQANLTKVAELLGISYRHLLRTLETLCKEGILEKDRHTFVIRDMEGLKALAQDCYAPMEIWN